MDTGISVSTISYRKPPKEFCMFKLFTYFSNLISIGSLGKDNSTAIVTSIVLDTAILRETANGVRIKSWQVLL